MKKRITSKRGYKSKEDKEMYEILGGKAVISLRTNSKNYQFRMWVKDEKKYVRETLHTDSLDDALKLGEDRCLDYLGKLKSGRKIFGLTIAEASDKFLEYQMSRVKKKHITKERYETIATQLNKWIVPFVGTLKENWGTKYKVSDLGIHSFKYYGQYRREKTKFAVQDVTIRNEYTTINSLIRFLYEEGQIKIIRIKPEEIRIKGDLVRRRDTFTLEEYRVLTKSLKPFIKNSKDIYEEFNRKLLRDFILIKSNTYMRFGELIKLKWKMVNVYTAKNRQQTRMCTIKLPASITKNSKDRTVIAVGGTYFDRLRHYTENNKADSFVFTQYNSNTQINKHTLYREWKKLLAFSKLDNIPDKHFSFYALRHFGITARLYSNVSMSDVAKMAGTSYTFIENHYDHTDMSKLEEQAMKSFKVDKETGMIELGVRD